MQRMKMHTLEVETVIMGKAATATTVTTAFMRFV